MVVETGDLIFTDVSGTTLDVGTGEHGTKGVRVPTNRLCRRVKREGLRTTEDKNKEIWVPPTDFMTITDEVLTSRTHSEEVA